MYFRVCPHCGCALILRNVAIVSRNGGNEGKWNVEEVETEE